jgi:osmotically-inducible protein OsmY
MRLHRVALIGILALAIASQGCVELMAAGAATAVVAASDRRTVGSFIDDNAIEMKAGPAIRAVPGLADQVHINVTSLNGVVLLTGEASAVELRDQVLGAVRDVPGVRRTVNEIRIAPPSTLASRSNDAWLTTKVKTQLASARELESWHVKVVTESSAVYLMGLINRAQGDVAAEAARTVGGVERVVKLFEYLD